MNKSGSNNKLNLCVSFDIEQEANTSKALMALRTHQPEIPLSQTRLEFLLF